MSIEDIVVLRSARRYITWVALENCVEYFLSVQCIGANNTPVIEPGKELLVFRRFLNAVESLNNIPDYLYHETGTANVALGEFRKNLESNDPALPRINQIANAYKHHVRGTSKGSSFQPTPNALNSRDIVFDHRVICDAFKFWSQYK